MRVFSPNRNFNGFHGTDVFINGLCEDGSERHRDYYERRGYIVVGDGEPDPTFDLEPSFDDDPEPETPAARTARVGVEPPPASATTAEWREFADAVGLDVAPSAKRSQIIAAYEATQN